MPINRTRIAALALSAALAAAPVFAQAPPPPAFTGNGPYAALSEAAPGLATHTLYRPRDLGSVKGQKLPIVLWANGACANDNRHFKPFLTEIASHGYFIVAIGPYDPAPLPSRPVTPEPAAPTPPPGEDPTKSSQLIDALNWAQAENGRVGSPFKGLLAIDKVAVMGQSCGGLQALDVSPDPRITTSVIWNSGIYTRPGGRSGIHVPKEKLNALHAPIAYFIGGPTDIAYPNAVDDYARIDKVPALIAQLPLWHSGNYDLPEGGPFAPVGAAWLDWRLKGDAKAAKVFVGPNCGLCGDPAWSVQSKNLR
ncbi:MAG: alpha/beta hydrolase [Caulobacteraceae bacterium]